MPLDKVLIPIDGEPDMTVGEGLFWISAALFAWSPFIVVIILVLVL